MKDPTLNIRAYQNVESLNNYRNADELAKYRMQRLNDVQKNSNYIKRYVYRERPLRVLEYCSGSSCLLYSLESQGILEKGVGIEISPSRHMFAERWKEDHHFQKVENLNINVQDSDFEDNSFDLILMVDSAFNYFYPEDPSLPSKILRNSWQYLSKGGFLLFNMMTRVRERERFKKEGVYRYWIEMPEDNPFRFGLYQQEMLSWEESLILTQNIYIHKNGTIDDSKKEVTKFYSLNNLKDLLISNGFGEFKKSENFDDAEYLEGRSEHLTLLAMKK